MPNNITDIAVAISEKEIILNAERIALAEKIVLLKTLVLREIEIMIESNSTERKEDLS